LSACSKAGCYESDSLDRVDGACIVGDCREPVGDELVALPPGFGGKLVAFALDFLGSHLRKPGLKQLGVFVKTTIFTSIKK
jgi:hypothetical protein